MLVKCVRGLGLQEDERKIGDVDDQRQEVEELKELHFGRCLEEELMERKLSVDYMG